jgi:hypothetical protein
MQRVFRLQPSETDKANRSTDYQLLPVNQVPPIISAQPTRGFYQTTWLEAPDQPKPFIPTTNRVQMVEGTQFGMTVIAIDPSNLQNPNDDSNLKYVWKRDGSPLYEINKLNNNRGIRGLSVPASESRKELSGVYTVEISNQYGTTTSGDLIINIFKVEEHPFLYKNLLLNGNGDEGLDGWNADTSIRTEGYFQGGFVESNNFGSFNVKLDEPLNDSYRQQLFHFAKGSNWNNLPGVYTRITNNDNVDDPGFRWSRSFPAALIPNEAKESSRLGTFFPDPSWIDTFNTNTGINTPTLSQELEKSNAYFTRDPVKFNKFTDRQQDTIKASQIIDLTEVADVIDGNVFGINELYAQFFAYIGIGLTRYKFRVPFKGKTVGLLNISTVPTSSTETNWFILDKRVYEDIGDDFNTRGPASEFYPEGGVDETKPIELIPLAEDITNVQISYLDENDQVIGQYPVAGPTAEDIFAVKEKFYIPKFIETPIRNGISYKDITVYYEFDLAKTEELLNAWKEEADLQGVRVSLKALSNAVSTVANPEIFYNQIISLIKTLDSNTLVYPFIDFSKIETEINIILAGISVIAYILPLPLRAILLAVLNRVTNALSELSLAANNAEQELSGLPQSTYLDDNVFYNVFYPVIVEFLKTYVYILDEDLANEDIANEDAGSSRSFAYLANQRLRLAEYNTWVDNYKNNNDNGSAYKDSIDDWEQRAVDQYFLIFGKFLEYAESGKRRIEQSNRYTNPIKIYDQTYSTVDAISNFTDENLKWINVNLSKRPGLTGQYPLRPDPGAAAFFAIQHTESIPVGTRKVQITFEFKNTSEMVSDLTPETKNWDKEELYVDLFGNTNEDKDVYFKYGPPRCAITSMKYVLYPGDVTINPRYNSYHIPNENIWYTERVRLEDDVYNSSKQLRYNVTTVDNILPLSSLQLNEEEIANAIQRDASQIEAQQVQQSTKN